MSSKKKRVLTFGEGAETTHPSKKYKHHSTNNKYMKFSTRKNEPMGINERQKRDTMSQSQRIPLAEKMRPSSLFSYVGQKDIVGPNSLLYNLLNKRQIPSMILWGPPGCGKTTLANIIVNLCRETLGKSIRIIRLSAITSGIGDIREAVNIANKETRLAQKIIVIMDEIHRFNKLQQDIFLPHVEAGTFTLIGATTENPSYSLNSALLSRCRVFTLTKLAQHEITEILYNAIRFTNGIICDEKGKIDECNTSDAKYAIDAGTITWLAEVCDGDARIALGGLELAIQKKVPNKTNVPPLARPIIMLIDVKESLKEVHMLSDTETNQSHNIYSALHKSISAGKANAALYWLARIMALKEDPVNIARRLIKISSEDVGLANPNALGIAVHTMHGCQMIGMPECDVLLGQCVVYLCNAPKSRLIYNAFKAAEKFITEYIGPQPSVPLHIRCRSGEGKLQGSAGKHLVRKDDDSQNYLPSGLEHIEFFEND